MCHRKRGQMRHSRMPRTAKTLGQRTGVNVDRTGRGAKTIYRVAVQRLHKDMLIPDAGSAFQSSDRRGPSL